MIWGIDFGTSTSLLSYSARGPVRTALMGSANNWIPSLAGRRDGRYVFGEEALPLSDLDLVSAVKRRITEGNHETVTIGWGKSAAEVEVDEIVLGLLKTVRLKGQGLFGSDDITARLGCPAIWDGPRRRRLLDLADKAGLEVGDSPLVDEPIAACISWVQDEITSGNQVQGSVLVYDMGGGTLDVAVIAVDTVTGNSPKYFVKSSTGAPIAGEKIDEAIVEYLCRQIAEDYGIGLERVVEESVWLRRPAREIKESLSRNRSVTLPYVHPAFGEIVLRLSQTQLTQLAAPLLDLAWQSVLKALRDARLTHFSEGRWGTGVHLSEVFKMDASDLLANVDYVVLAGGMAPMRAIRDMFLGQNVPEHKIRVAGGRLGAPNEAISRGLAEDLDSQQLNLARPAFDLVVEWGKYSTNSAGETAADSSGEITIFEAYSPLYKAGNPGTIPRFKWEPDDQLPYSSYASLKVIDRNTGERIRFNIHGQRDSSMELDFAASSLRHITLAPNGNLLIVGQGSKPLHQVRVASWPVLKDSEDRSVTVVLKGDEFTPYEPMWWEG